MKFAKPPVRGGLAMAALAAMLAFPIAPAISQDGQPNAAANAAADVGKLEQKVERVVVFKDGYGLVIKSGSGVVSADGTVFIDDVPSDAVLGCLWATLDDGQAGKAVAVRAEWIESVERQTREVPCTSMVDVLRANVGRSVRILPAIATADAAPPIEGTIVEVLEIEAEELTDERWLASVAGHGAMETVVTPSPHGSKYVVIDVNNAAGAVTRRIWPIDFVASVESATGTDLATCTAQHQVTIRRAKRLTFTVGKNLAGQTASLKFVYFAPGVRWIPTYRVSGDLATNANIALQAEIINDITDFDGATLDLVVGVPNFRFKDTRSPLTLEVMMRQTTQHVPAMRGREFSNAITSQQVYQGDFGGPVETDNTANLAPELAAGGTQDMFVYSVPNVELQQGGRATLPLWQSTVPLKHVYTMDLNIVRQGRTGAAWMAGESAAPSMGGNSPIRLSTNRVWHQLELTNNTKVPFTTGAALIMREHIPLGQELLTYTSMGGCVLLPVTVAVDMRGNYEEEEIARQPNALQWAGYTYAKIRKRATVTMVNFRSEKSIVRIAVGVGGRAMNVSHDGKLRIDDFRAGDWADYGLTEPNNHSEITWEFELPAGETRTMTFEFDYYVR